MNSETGSGTALPAPPLTLGELISLYLKSPKFYSLSLNSSRVYRLAAKRLAPIGHLVAMEVRPSDLRPLHDKLAKFPGAYNNFRSAVLGIFKYGQLNDIVESNPAMFLDRAKTGSRRAWLRGDIEPHINNARDDMISLAITLGFYTAQRIGDLVSLKWGQYDGEVIKFKQQKTGTELSVPVHPRLKEALDAWRIYSKSEHVLNSPSGRPFNYNTFNKQYRKRVPHALPSFHGIRKAAAQEMASLGASPFEIQAMTGHKSLESVMVYVRGANMVSAARKIVGRME